MKNQIKAVLVFVLALAMAALLGACNSSTTASNDSNSNGQPSLPGEEWSPVAGQGEGQLPAGSVAVRPLSIDYTRSSGSSEGLGVSYVYSFGNCASVDYVFLATIESIEPYSVTYLPTTDFPDPASDDAPPPNIVLECDITVRIDRVFSGDNIEVGDTVVIFASDVADMKGGSGVVVGSQAVFLADDVFTNTEWGRLDIRPSQIAMFPDLKEPLGKADMWITGDNHYYIYPAKDNFVAAPLEWAFDVKPTVALSKNDCYILSEGLGSAGYTGIDQFAAYYSIDDFAKALAFYQNKYPTIQATTLSGKAIPGESEPTSFFDPSHLSANEDRLAALQEQTGYAAALGESENDGVNLKPGSQSSESVIPQAQVAPDVPEVPEPPQVQTVQTGDEK